MSADIFREFVNGNDTLHVYREGTLIFKSQKDRLLPLLDYLEKHGDSNRVVIMDKVMGNAAALLAIRAGCGEVYSPLGSDYGAETLKAHGIEYHITEMVPFITKADGTSICPMEKLSIGKSPEEFYQVMKSLTANH